MHFTSSSARACYGTRCCGFRPGRGRWIFIADKKSVARTSFGAEVNPSVPCRRFTACKRTLQSLSEMLCRRISRTPFLTRVSPPSLPDGSGCWIRKISIVLLQQTSHLLLIRTNSGYGTLLTAACVCPGCSATQLLLCVLQLLLYKLLFAFSLKSRLLPQTGKCCVMSILRHVLTSPWIKILLENWQVSR
jgi:hypothetical protein